MVTTILRQTVLIAFLSVTTLTASLAQSHKHNPAELLDQLVISPEFSPMQAFAGIELWNRINVKNVQASGVRGVSMLKLEGPGEIKQNGANYFWGWKPDRSDIGKSFTVKISALAHRGAGAKDNASTEFPVVVNQVQQADHIAYYSLPDATAAPPKVGQRFLALTKIAALDGAYKSEFYVDGRQVRTSNEPNIDFTPDRGQQGKRLELKTYYKSTLMANYTLVHDTSWTIAGGQ
jgi:hypothetical protein